MKNLQATIRRHIALQSNVVGSCVDSDNGILFVINDQLKLFKAQIYSEEVTLEEQNFNEKLVTLTGATNINQNDVRLFEFVVEVGSLFLALKSGHLLMISVTSTDCHCIYKHNRNISSISLSPSQDLIALADEENNIQVMYCSDCDIIHKSNALTQNESLHKPVGVGWGSKETQFFGLDGRPSQEKQQPTKVELNDEENSISDQIESSAKFKEFQCRQERSTVIDWRGDGQLITTLTYLPESDKHYLKVWNRNLELQYMSEQLVTVERGLLCWIPDGRYICCAQRRDRRLNELAIFEKNGLVRQRISLPTMMADMYIANMAWSTDSKIFSVIVKQFQVTDGKVLVQNILMLYTMQNWHYYLKTSIKLKNDCDYSLKWDSSNINRLHIMSTTGLYIEYDCCFQVTYSDNYSTVAVVDGNKVLVTPLEKCIMPPPMCAITLETKSPIHKLAISKKGRILILTLDGLLIYTSDIDCSKTEDDALKIELNNRNAQQLHDRITNYRVSMLEDADSYQHLVLIDNFGLVASRITPGGSQLIRIDLPGYTLDKYDGDSDILELLETSDTSKTFEKGQVCSQTNEPVFEILKTFEKRQVISISRSVRYNKSLNIILNDSSSFRLHPDGLIEPFFDIQSTIAESRFSYSIMDLTTIDSYSYSASAAMISLGQDYCLRFNKNILASNCCTSFRISENYLIYTTSENNMHFILLRDLFNSKLSNTPDSWSQQIENGGTLITVSEKDSKVILQMPRGNLETIHPRVLLFSELVNLMSGGEYVQACKLARRHRVNMNFLVDCLTRLCPENINYVDNWQHFAKTVAKEDPNLLCLVITELDNVDTISDRYSSIIKHIPPRETFSERSFEPCDKVNRFCSRIDLYPLDKTLFPQIQCMLRMEPKETGRALEIVYRLAPDLKNDAIKYILYFIDIDQLFKDALSTYDSDIALMVAGASNKDPKQYLALLDDFNSIKNEELRRFKIDVHIKRYDHAFNHLRNLLVNRHQDITTEYILEFVISKRIYKHAICETQVDRDEISYDFKAPFEENSEFNDEMSESSINTSNLDLEYDIWAKYADYLLEKRHYSEAGLAYSKAFNGSGKNIDYLNSALKCYSFAEDWEKSMALIVRGQVDFAYKQEASRKLTKQLLERGKYHEMIIIEQLISRGFAGDLKLNHLQELATARYWYLAEILAGNDREKFWSLVDHVDLLEQANSQVKEWQAELTTARDQFERLKEVLTTQQTRGDLVAEKGFISDTLSTVDGSELSSISGSGNQQIAKVARSGATSIKTRSSSKSSRSTNKRINLKTGSRHEDIALVLELKKFISKQKTNREECVKFSATLFQYLQSTARAYLELDRFKDVLNKSLEFAQQVSELLWPIGPHLEQKYSLYKKLNNTILTDTYENVDFDILIRPELPKCLDLFDI